MASPPKGRVSTQTQRDQRSRNAKFAQLSPQGLRAYLDRAASGHFEDFADLCDRMKREDPQIRSTYGTRLAAVAGTRSVVEAEGADPIDVEFAAFCGDVLKEMQPVPGEWESCDQTTLAMKLLDGIGVGFGACELEWQRAIRPTRAIRFGDWVIPTARWVHQRRFLFADDWKLKLRDDGVRTYAQGLDLEADKFIIHIPQDVAGYPTQTGLFWAICWSFVFKRWGEQYWADGLERLGWATPYLTQDVNATTETAQEGLEFLSKMTQGLNAVLPQGTTLDLLETAVKDAGAFRTFINHYDSNISKAILGTSDATEPGKVGAWKAVESRTGTNVHPRMSLDASALASTYRTQLFEPLRRYNPRFARAQLPRIRWLVSSEQETIPRELVEAGGVTINEMRAKAKLPPVPWGDERAKIGSAAAAGASQQPAAPEAATPSPLPDPEAMGGPQAA